MSSAACWTLVQIQQPAAGRRYATLQPEDHPAARREIPIPNKQTSMMKSLPYPSTAFLELFRHITFEAYKNQSLPQPFINPAGVRHAIILCRLIRLILVPNDKLQHLSLSAA